MKKIISILLIMVLIIGNFPNGAEKAKAISITSGDYEYSIEDGVATVRT